MNLARDHSKNRRQAFWSRVFGRASSNDVARAAQHVADPRSSPERELLAREELAAVWLVVDRLSRQQRAIFLLRFAEEMTLEEIAKAMELELGTVKAHLARAVGAVRQRLAALRRPDTSGKGQEHQCRNI